MKLGAEKKSEVIALVVLLGVAAALFARSFLTTGGAAPVPASIAVPAASGGEAGAASSLPVSLSRLDPRLDLAKLAALRARAYDGNGRNLFRFGAAPPPPPSPAATSARIAAAARAAAARVSRPAGPPPPPPIPLTFYGFARMAGGTERIFLHYGEDTYVVSQGETIAHRYQIVNIGKVAVRVKDLTTQAEQEVPLQRPGPGI